MDQFSYATYYNRVINKDTNGLKYVLGGTGLGKTSAIADVIKQNTTERQYIYIANRVQLLNEMSERLQADGIGYVHLQKDSDTVFSVLRGPHKHDLYHLLHSELVERLVTSINQKGSRYHLTPQRMTQICGEIEQHLASHSLRSELLTEVLERRAITVMNFFKRIVIEASKYEGQSKRGKEYTDLLNHPVICNLFPYIAFKRDKSLQILLITIQKAYHGFFDGREHVSLTTLTRKNGNHIIFLDEFDFLEHDLIQLICEDTQITAPAQFVAHFYQVMKYHKLPLADYPHDSRIRQRIAQIVEMVDSLKSMGLPFPTINQFTCTLTDIKDFAIFETKHFVLTQDLYLHATDRSFEIVNSSELNNENTIHVSEMFRVVRFAVSDILRLFAQLSVESPALYRELLRQCFDNTVFKEQIERIHQVPRTSYTQNSRFDALLEQGFGFSEIVQLEQESDPSEVGFSHYAIYTTPEKILATMAEDNLVFGLSATAGIPRNIRNFNNQWLANQPTFPYYPLDNDDISIIQALNQAKQQRRNNAVNLVQANELAPSDPMQKQMIRFIESVAGDDGFGGDDPKGYRRLRLNRFLATLVWITNTTTSTATNIDTHLLFFTSYRQIKHMLIHHQNPEHGLFSVTKHGEAGIFEYYEVQFAEKCFLIVLYDAAQGQKIKTDSQVRKAYHELFWQGKSVILVTTYPSAGNGVNLHYRPLADSDLEQDIQHVHLLESPYFYFGNIDPDGPSEAQAAVMKENLWYLAKLFEAKIISESEFKAHLGSIRSNGLSTRYLQDSSTRRDAFFNQIATFIQALGRIERVWSSMPDQVVRLSRDVYEVFEIVTTREQFADFHTDYAATLSHNVQQVVAQVLHQAGMSERQIERTKDERLPAINHSSQRAIRRLLDRLAALRAGSGDHSVRYEWQQLRRAILSHDFAEPLLTTYHCTFRTHYYHNGCLYLTDEGNLVPSSVWSSTVSSWDVNAIYSDIAQNPVIRRHFEAHGYELGFSTTTQQFFTPYCYQAILTGAIGEEAISALLAYQGIPLEPLADAVFELADLKIKQHPWYIDCKYYSERTLANFVLTSDDPAWRPKLNQVDFKRSVQHKLAAIRAAHPREVDQCKLIYLNTVSTNDRVNRYLNDQFELVEDFEVASIVVIQGVLNQANPDTYTNSFRSFLDQLEPRI